MSQLLRRLFCFVFGHEPLRIIEESKEHGEYEFVCKDCGTTYRWTP